MEIHWGNFSLVLDKAAALMLFVLPVVIVMQLPIAVRIIRRVIIWLRKRKEQETRRLHGDRQ